MARADGDIEDVDGTEADTADVIEQAEPLSAEPVEDALQERAIILPGDPEEEQREQEDAAEAGGGDPEEL